MVVVAAGGSMFAFPDLFLVFSRRRCISRRKSNPEEGKEQLVDRLWDRFLPECGRGKVV
jgi:hypothetical protein